MTIKYSTRFENEFLEIYNFIAFDSIKMADKFKYSIKESIKTIPNMPYKNRKSIKTNDESIRELIFKKYVIVYKIYTDEIFVLGIFSQNIWEL